MLKIVNFLMPEIIDTPNFKIQCLADEDQSDTVNLTGCYIAKSRAIYKLIYVHPPKYKFLESDFQSRDNSDEFFACLLIRNDLKGYVPSPLERILIWHQDLHFGKGPMDEKEIRKLINDYKDRLNNSFQVVICSFSVCCVFSPANIW